MAGPLVLKVHGEPVKPPAPLVVKVTVPDGARGLPTSLSVMVAVHVAVCPTGMEDGTHTTLVEVDRALAVIVTVLLVLPLWPPSPW